MLYVLSVYDYSSVAIHINVYGLPLFVFTYHDAVYILVIRLSLLCLDCNNRPILTRCSHACYVNILQLLLCTVYFGNI